MYSYCQGKLIGAVPGLLFCFFKYNFFLAFKESKSDILKERQLLEGCGIQPPLPPPATPKKKSAQLLGIPAQGTAQP